MQYIKRCSVLYATMLMNTKIILLFYIEKILENHNTFKYKMPLSNLASYLLTAETWFHYTALNREHTWRECWMKGGGYHYSLIKTFHLHLINLQLRDNACMNKARRVLKEHGSQIYRHFYGGHCKLRTIPIFMLFFYDLNSTK